MFKSEQRASTRSSIKTGSYARETDLVGNGSNLWLDKLIETTMCGSREQKETGAWYQRHKEPRRNEAVRKLDYLGSVSLLML